MRGSFRSFSSTFFVSVGLCGLLVFVVGLITGGFVVDTGLFRLSARRWDRPLVIAVVAWTMAALHGRVRMSEAAASISVFLERHAVAFALVMAFAVAGVGIAFGTYSASSSDAAGYVSQSRLLAAARITQHEPLAHLVEWPETTWAFSPLGYRPGLRAGEIVPTYPAGVPAMMAAARLVGGEWAPFLVVPFLGGLAAVLVFALGAALHGRTAALAATVLFSTSPILFFQLVQPMSDVPTLTMWTLALWLALQRRRDAAFAAGAAAGVALCTRPNLVPMIAAIAVVVAGWPRAGRDARDRRWALLLHYAAGLSPFVAALAALNWHLYGSPVASGYGSLGEFFSLSNIQPNVRDYAWRLFRGEGPALGVAFVSLGVLLLTDRHRGSTGNATTEVTGVRTVRAAAFLAGLVLAALLFCYLPFGVFPDWSYLRFLLPAFPASFVVVGALLTTAASRVPAPARALVVLMALAVAASFNVNHAAREQAFNLWRYEARYRDAGLYLAAALPPAAVVFAAQESASARYYADAPVVRWDSLLVDLDTAVAQIAALGRRPLLLVEDWEVRDLRTRFPTSAIARLDWPARAEFGSVTRVFLFDLSDREQPRGSVVTDRLR